MTDFDTANHWLIDRGNGSPSVNLVVLAFVDPLKLLGQTNDSGDANGVPVGMNSAVVNYFTGHGVRVMLGYMFWAAERPSTRFVTTAPPNSCQGGVGVGATTYSVPVPMPALRQN